MLKLDLLDQLKKCLHIYVAPTAECGYGAFTARAFREGESIIVNDNPGYFLDQMSRKEALERGYDIAKDCFECQPGRFLAPEGNIDDFMNHSCSPNTGLVCTEKSYTVLALTDIPKDAELTYDYSTYTFSDDDVFDCLCRSADCRNTVGAFESIPRRLRDKYTTLGVTWTGKHVVRGTADDSARRVPRAEQAVGSYPTPRWQIPPHNLG